MPSCISNISEASPPLPYGKRQTNGVDVGKRTVGDAGLRTVEDAGPYRLEANERRDVGKRTVGDAGPYGLAASEPPGTPAYYNNIVAFAKTCKFCEKTPSLSANLYIDA